MTGSLPARPDKEYPHQTIREESAHGGSAIEWWFVQGYYDGAGSGRRYFMSVAFRIDLGSSPPSSTVGFSSLLSVLDPRTGQHQTRSKIDPVLFNSSIQAEGRLPEHNLDSQLVKLCQREMAEHGPLRPIFLEESQVKLQSAPFCFDWKDFSLAQFGPKFLLKFIEPASKRVCEFNLVPSTSRLKVEENPTRPMSYYCYPRLQLRGKVNDEAVDGVAWLDHQWGDWNWFFAHDSGRVLGWDWFGFNLDDGSDWILLVHRDAATGKPVSSNVTMRDRAGKVRSCQDLRAKPTRYWLSQATHIRHPVAWDIQIPDLEATFTFEPIVEDQEIAIFGMAQAVWEGAGHISGMVAGRQMSGRARGEFHGYGYVFDFQRLLRDFGERVDQRIEAFLPRVIDEAQLEKYLGTAAWKREPEAYTPLLSGPVWDLLSRRSKHWRPVFALLLLEALGAPSNVYEDLAVLGAELPHTGALIIDDIEDSSQIRRGEECIHLRYGLDVAINAANTLYFLPSLYIMDHPELSEGQRIRIYEVIWKSYVHAHFGQALDIYWSRNLDRKKVTRWIDDDLRLKILQMYDDKTGAIVEALSEIAVVIAGSAESTRQACVSFARNMAVAFQIVDDILNFSEASEWTKTCGEDLKEGKLTYVITRAIELLESSHKERLVEILCDADLRKTPAILREGIELVQRSGALADCRSEAESMFHAAWSQFSASIAPSYAKILLHMLCIRTLHLSGDP